MPFLTHYLGQPLIAKAQSVQQNVLLKPIDATLGVAGLPQSATGQTTLYTGQNAPKFLGRHQSGFANGSLRSLIDHYGLFRRALLQGKTATLANAYSPEYFYAIAQRKRRYSVCTLLNLLAQLPFRMQYEYDQEKALYWNITGEAPPQIKEARNPISPQLAGQRLAALSAEYGVTLFESYLTDYAGHAQDKASAVKYLQRIDSFLQSTIHHLPPHVTLLVTSDHGNVENLSTKHHTLNPVPLLAVGIHAHDFAPVINLTGITPKILALL
ncbi:MAG: phosphoglycerate mutase [Phormidesmis priestleyi Ana]|uniref:Phosphoglycerate mutase n=1 Tax=Phormidesmis priestleyi Ana TaxID=1666911 RepID=A0A0P7Z0I2_9CYAN|nr:MAG: phosphoglycerate mutase [Phormidesmis priestleyi Ana]